MKKGFCLLSLGLMMFALSGCTTQNKLYCTKVTSSDTDTTMQEITVHFKDEMVKDMSLSISQKMNASTEAAVDESYQKLLGTLDKYKDNPGYKITSKKSSDTIHINLFVEPAKIVQEDQNLILDFSANKESVKNSYVEQGFTCE